MCHGESRPTHRAQGGPLSSPPPRMLVLLLLLLLSLRLLVKKENSGCYNCCCCCSWRFGCQSTHAIAEAGVSLQRI